MLRLSDLKKWYPPLTSGLDDVTKCRGRLPTPHPPRGWLGILWKASQIFSKIPDFAFQLPKKNRRDMKRSRIIAGISWRIWKRVMDISVNHLESACELWAITAMVILPCALSMMIHREWSSRNPPFLLWHSWSVGPASFTAQHVVGGTGCPLWECEEVLAWLGQI